MNNVYTRSLAILMLLSGCRLAGPATHHHQARGSQVAIVAMLQAQADHWNAGDIDAFMQSYWQSPQLCFVSSSGITRGWRATMERYRRRYPTREAMGRLSFTDLEVRMLAPHAALVVGRWDLAREQPIGGRFTLIVRKIDNQWVIVHDHTSQDAS